MCVLMYTVLKIINTVPDGRILNERALYTIDSRWWEHGDSRMKPDAISILRSVTEGFFKYVFLLFFVSSYISFYFSSYFSSYSLYMLELAVRPRPRVFATYPCVELYRKESKPPSRFIFV